MGDTIWAQVLDYENTSFLSHICHKKWHLQNSCSLQKGPQKKEKGPPKPKKWQPGSLNIPHEDDKEQYKEIHIFEKDQNEGPHMTIVEVDPILNWESLLKKEEMVNGSSLGALKRVHESTSL